IWLAGASSGACRRAGGSGRGRLSGCRRAVRAGAAATSLQPLEPAATARAPALRASLLTACAADMRPLIAGTRRLAAARSVITTLEPVWGAIAAAGAPARPAGPWMATLWAYRGALTATAATPIHRLRMLTAPRSPKLCRYGEP